MVHFIAALALAAGAGDPHICDQLQAPDQVADKAARFTISNGGDVKLDQMGRPGTVTFSGDGVSGWSGTVLFARVTPKGAERLSCGKVALGQVYQLPAVGTPDAIIEASLFAAAAPSQDQAAQKERAKNIEQLEAKIAALEKNAVVFEVLDPVIRNGDELLKRPFDKERLGPAPRPPASARTARHTRLRAGGEAQQ